MERIEKTVFLSYRRTNAPWALAIFQNLTHYGYDVFFDFSGIASGDFERVIIGNIKARAHFLVLLTPSALERCGEPGDWLRREIETALDTHRNIVPLMLEGFDFGAPGIASGLTGTLALLRNYNGMGVSVEYFDAAMQKLREKFLNVALDAVLHPASPFAQQAAKDDQAAARAAPAVTEKELTAQEWFERAVNAANLDEKLRFYSEAIRLKPDYAEAFNNRGVARVDKGDLEGAQQDWSEAIRLKPDYALPFNNRGNARKAKGDMQGALQDYDEAIRLEPDNIEAFNNRAIARYAKGDMKGALQDWSIAILLKPDYAEAFYNRGFALDNEGDLEGALRDYDEAIRHKADYASALNNRGNVRAAKGDLEGALQDINESLRLQPDSAFAFDSRGNLRAAKGDMERALQDYDEALRLKPDLAEAFFNRGNARKAKGDIEGAQQDFDDAARLGFKPKK